MRWRIPIDSLILSARPVWHARRASFTRESLRFNSGETHQTGVVDQMAENIPRSEGSGTTDPVSLVDRDNREALGLHKQAAERQHAAATKETIGFGRQMLQLVLIPALIVGGVLAVWMIVISLGGQAQSLDSVLAKLNTTGGSLPADQERARTALSLLSIIEGSTGESGSLLSEDDRNKLVTELPKIARLQRGGHEELCRAIMGALGLLADPSTIKVFEEFLESPDEKDWFAAVSGMHGWRGDMTLFRPLTADLLKVLRNAPRPTGNPKDDRPIESLPAITMSVLAVVADPQNQEVLDALNKELGSSAGTNRDLVWNAGCALAVLGDERGIPFVVTLLDREWLKQQPYDSRRPELGLMDEPSLRKIISSTINVVVGFDPRLGGFTVRVEAPQVWAMIEQLAASDPDASIKDLARAALNAREAQKSRPADSGGG